VSFSRLVSEAQGYQLTDLEAQDLARWRIYRLRKLIEVNANEPKLILSDPGVGYRLNITGLQL
jgi:DNA-binding response OmpR family regulator